MGTGGALACGAAPSDGCPSLMTQSLTRDFIQRRADRGVATSPNARLESRLNDSAWDADANGASPFTATPGDEITEFGTSFSQVGSWMTKTDAEKIKAAEELLAKGQKLPVPATIDRSMDVWTQTRVTKGPAISDTGGKAYTSYLGADYKPVDGVVLGGMVQMDSADAKSVSLGGASAGQGYMAGPYMAMQLAPGVTFDARAVWGEAQDSITAGSAATQFDTRRSHASMRLKGDWSWNAWHVSPVATIESINETAVAGPGQIAAEAGFNRMSVGPRFSRQFHVGNDKSIEPFVHVNSGVALDSSGAFLNGEALDMGEAYNTVGGGFSLSKTDDYTFSATADVDTPSGDAEKNVRTGVKLTIPLD